MSEKVKKLSDFFFASLAFIIFLFVIPILLIIYVTLMMKKRLVEIELKRKYKDEFARIMGFKETFWAMNDCDSIEIITYIETNHDKSHVNLYNYVRESVEKLYECKQEPFSKVFYTRGLDLDYYFWKKIPKINIDNYVSIYNFKTKEECIDYNAAKDFVNDIVNKPYPGNVIMSIYIGDKPIINDKATETGKKVYVVLWRLHHCYGDGVNFKKMIHKMFELKHRADDDKIIEMKIQQLHEKYNINSWKIIAYFNKSFFYFPLTVFRLITYPKDKNILHGPNISGTVFKGWKMDNEKDSLMSKIGRIRKRIPDTSYNEVVLTALSHSFSAYFVKNENKMQVPSFISVGVTMRVLKLNLNSKDTSKEFDNDFSIATLKLPINRNFERKRFYKTMICVKESLKELKKSTELMTLVWVMDFMKSFPVSFLRKLFQKSSMTLAYTNLPGASKVYLQNDFAIKDFIFTNPVKLQTGVGASFLTYNNTLEIGLTIDSVLTKDKNDVEFILDEFVSCIKYMDEHTFN